MNRRLATVAFTAWVVFFTSTACAKVSLLLTSERNAYSQLTARRQDWWVCLSWRLILAHPSLFRLGYFYFKRKDQNESFFFFYPAFVRLNLVVKCTSTLQCVLLSYWLQPGTKPLFYFKHLLFFLCSVIRQGCLLCVFSAFWNVCSFFFFFTSWNLNQEIVLKNN